MPFKKKQSTTPTGIVVLEPLPKALTVKACQQEFGKARAREEAFLDQLERAQQEFSKVSAESVADDNLDIGVVADAMTAAQHKVDAPQKALLVAKQRTAAAEAALKTADWESRRQSCLRLVEKLTDVLRDWHIRQVEAAEYLRDDALPLIEEIRASGFDMINHKLNSFGLAFKPKLLGLYQFMPNCQTAEILFLRDEPVIAMAPTADDVERLKRV